MNRRGFLTGSAAVPAALAWETKPEAGGIVDCNVYLSRWPFRELPEGGAAKLAALLRAHGVAQAWAGSFDAVLHKNLSAANARLAGECREHGRGLLVPFGCVNPTLPDWEEDLRRCQEEFTMPGIRVHPNYHGYTLADPGFERLLRAAAQRGLLVQIICWMEDERHHNARMMIPSVNPAPLPALLGKIPKARVVLSNAFPSVGRGNKVLAALRECAQVALDFAISDGFMVLRTIIAEAGIERVVFGSYLPMFYIESAELKMREAQVTAAETAAIHGGNARRLLAG